LERLAREMPEAIVDRLEQVVCGYRQSRRSAVA